MAETDAQSNPVLSFESCLTELRRGGWIKSETELAAVGFKTIMARGLNGCVRLDESAVRSAQQIKFKPAKLQNQPVDFPARVRIQFRLAY